MFKPVGKMTEENRVDPPLWFGENGSSQWLCASPMNELAAVVEWCGGMIWWVGWFCTAKCEYEDGGYAQALPAICAVLCLIVFWSSAVYVLRKMPELIGLGEVVRKYTDEKGMTQTSRGK